MMNRLRENSAIVLWVLVFAFVATIIFAWGMGGVKSKNSPVEKGILAKINGEKIMYRNFEQQVVQRVSRENQEGDQAVDSDRIKQIRLRTWNDNLNLTLERQWAEKRKLRAYDEEIFHRVRNYPPAEVVNSPQFQTDSTFDSTLWFDFLNNPQYQNTIIGLEQQARQTLPITKYRSVVFASPLLTDLEALDQELWDRRTARVKFINVRYQDMPFDSSEIIKEQMQTYYREHKKDFEKPREAEIEYVEFPLETSPEDSANILEDARFVHDRAVSGDDWNDLAQVYSGDQANARNGGDLGWFGRGRMVKEFEDAVFAMEPGEISEPVLTNFGYHITKLLERRTNDKGEEEVHAAHILLKIEPSTATISYLRSRAEDFVSTAREEGFAVSAQQNNLEVKNPAPIREDGYLPGLGKHQRALDIIFKSKHKVITDPLHGRDAFYVYHVKRIIPAGTEDFEAVSGRIWFELKREVQLKKAAEKAAAIMEANQGVEDLSLFQTGDSLITVKETERPFKIKDYVPGIGKDFKFNLVVFSTEVGAIAGPIDGKYGSYILQPLEVTPVQEISDEFAASRVAVRKKYMDKLAGETYSRFMKMLHENADIEDNRYLFPADY